MLKDMLGFENRYFKVVQFLEYRTNDNGKRRRYWRCLCRCGNEKVLSTTELSTGRPLSCGCHVKVGVGNRKYMFSGTEDSRLSADELQEIIEFLKTLK